MIGKEGERGEKKRGGEREEGGNKGIGKDRNKIVGESCIALSISGFVFIWPLFSYLSNTRHL